MSVAEFILDIVLASFLAISHLFVLLVTVIWRRKKFRKGMHDSVFGTCFLLFSIFFGVFLPVGGFTFFDEGTSRTAVLIFATLCCPAPLIYSLHLLCFCIFIDGNKLVKRTLCKETSIRLDSPDCELFFSSDVRLLEATIICRSENKTIKITERHMQGGFSKFLEECKKIMAHDHRQCQEKG